MKFTTQRKDLLRALAHVVPVSDPKSTMPILGNVHLEADPDKLHGCLTASATNLEITATIDESVSVDDAGSLCLPARALLDRVKAMPEGELVFSTKDKTATLKAKASARKFTLSGIPSGEFPSLPELAKPEWSHELPVLDLAELLDATSFSISSDETRLHLSSLCIEAVDGSLRAVSTDGHRLSLLTLGDVPTRPPRQILVPRSGIIRIRALLESAKGSVRLALANKLIWVTVDGGASLCVKTVDAQFPPYEQVIPKDAEVTVELDRKALLGAVKAVSVSAPQGSNGVKLTLSKSLLKLKTESSDDGEGEDELAIDCNVNGSRTYGMNCGYLVQSLDAIATDKVIMKLSGELDPVVMGPVGSKRDQVLCLMPMRI
jgi:DNA polymerase-3 subunit beta